MVNNINTHHVATQLVRQFHRAALAHDAAEAAGDETAERIHFARVMALAEEVSFHPAGSPEAALYMAQLLRCDVGTSRCCVESEYETETRLDRMERLAVSLVQYLERTSGIDRADFHLEWYGGKECDAQAFGALASKVA